MHSISEVIIKSEIEMRKLGRLLANLFQAQDIITFSGDLGVGKTYLCKSIINKISNIKEISSPTFNIVHTYPFKDEIEIWHCDFYRIESFNEIEEIGIFEDLKKKIIFLEWPKFEKEIFRLDPLNISIDIVQHKDKKFTNLRKISFHGSKRWYSRFSMINGLIK